MLTNIEKVCGNCLHWDVKRANEMGISKAIDMCPCAVNACESDVIGAVVLLSSTSTCHGSTEWVASEEYKSELEELRERLRP